MHRNNSQHLHILIVNGTNEVFPDHMTPSFFKTWKLLFLKKTERYEHEKFIIRDVLQGMLVSRSRYTISNVQSSVSHHAKVFHVYGIKSFPCLFDSIIFVKTEISIFYVKAGDSFTERILVSNNHGKPFPTDIS